MRTTWRPVTLVQEITLTTTLTEPRPVAKKKPAGTSTPKRYGTLVRVSDVFADTLRRVAQLEQDTQANIADAHLLPILEARYKDAVIKEAKRVAGKP
jgi:hypothetical protein